MVTGWVCRGFPAAVMGKTAAQTAAGLPEKEAPGVGLVATDGAVAVAGVVALAAVWGPIRPMSGAVGRPRACLAPAASRQAGPGGAGGFGRPDEHSIVRAADVSNIEIASQG